MSGTGMTWNLDREFQMKVQTRGDFGRLRCFGGLIGHPGPDSSDSPDVFLSATGEARAHEENQHDQVITGFPRHRDADVLSLPSISAMAGTSKSTGRDGIAHRARIRSRRLFPFGLHVACGTQPRRQPVAGSPEPPGCLRAGKDKGQDNQHCSSKFRVHSRSRRQFCSQETATDTILTRRDFSARDFNTRVRFHEERIN